MADTNEKLNILLVDNDKFLVDTYCMKFSDKGYNVHGCLSVADALQTLRDGFKPHAIVFGVVMPERDGFYFLKSLADEKLARDASLIALTNKGDDATKTKVTELGADRLVVKASMTPSEVVNTVEGEIMRKRKS